MSKTKSKPKPKPKPVKVVPGQTIIAAEQLNRRCYAMEISPAYCDVAVKRWENLTGRKAVLATDEASQ